RTASPAPSYQSNPGTPPRTAQQPSDQGNPFGTPYSPRYFEHTPNGSIHRASSRTSTPTRFSGISARKLPPPPFPDLRSVSPLNSSTMHNDEPNEPVDDNRHLESDASDLDDDIDDRPEAMDDFGFIYRLHPSRSNSPSSFVHSEYLESEPASDEF